MDPHWPSLGDNTADQRILRERRDVSYQSAGLWVRGTLEGSIGNVRGDGGDDAEDRMKGQFGQPGLKLIVVNMSDDTPGSVLLTQAAVGVKPPDGVTNAADMLLWLVMLSCREKDGCPAGIFPRAFSDMPRS